MLQCCRLALALNMTHLSQTPTHCHPRSLSRARALTQSHTHNHTHTITQSLTDLFAANKDAKFPVNRRTGLRCNRYPRRYGAQPCEQARAKRRERREGGRKGGWGHVRLCS